MKIQNTKGDVSGWVVGVLIALAGVVLVLFIGFELLVIFGIISMDEMCSMGSSIRSKRVLGFKFWPQMCRSQSVDVELSEWDMCPTYKEQAREAESLESEAYSETLVYIAAKKCAMQQIAELMLRCWKTRGSGALDPDSTDCFHFQLTGYPDYWNMNIGFSELLEFMKVNNVSKTNITYFDKVTKNIIVRSGEAPYLNAMRLTETFGFGLRPGYIERHIEGTLKEGFLDSFETNEVAIMENEVWKIRYVDAELELGSFLVPSVLGVEWDYGPGDYIAIEPIPDVKITETPENCIRWPPCDDVCSFDEGYINDTREFAENGICYSDPGCKYICEVKEDESS